jgi:hypothetical protein
MHGIAPLNMLEAGVVVQLRSLVELGAEPDHGVVLAVTEAGRDARLHGLPFNAAAVLATLYPHWSWGHSGLVLQTGDTGDIGDTGADTEEVS